MCIGVAPEGSESYIIQNENYEDFVYQIKELVNKYRCVFHNSSFDVGVLYNHGICTPDFEDTMLMSYILYPQRPNGHSLKEWGEVLGYPKLEHKDFSEYTEEMGEYCKRDVDLTLKLYHTLLGELSSDPKAFSLYYNIDRPSVWTTIELERNGILVDVDQWNKQNEILNIERERLLKEIRKEVPIVPGKKSKTKNMKPDDKIEGFLPCGFKDGFYHWKKWEEFNPNSGDQIEWALKEYYQWEPKEFTPSGKACTSTEVLEGLNYVLADLLVKYSETNKLITTYGEAFLNNVDSDGRIRANFNSCITATGRYSSSNPNLQNIPKSGDTGDTIRKCFICPPGYKLVGIDCSSFQVRILAYYLQAVFPNNPDALVLATEFNTKEDADPHQAVADLIGIDRKPAKALNFGNIFGFGAGKLAKMIGISIQQAQLLLKKLKKMFPSLPELKEIVWKRCKDNKGVIHDLYGRRGVYPDILSEDSELQARAQRQAFNFVIQGTEASVMKLFLLNVLELCKAYDAKLVLQVHDEIVIEAIDDDTLPGFMEELEKIFSLDLLPGIKLKGESKKGDSWYECK